MSLDRVLRWGLIVGGTVVGLALAAGLLLYVLTAPRSGVVEGAWLVPAHSETYQSGSICFSRDAKTGQCTFSTPTYSTRWVPDACYVKLNDQETSHREATWTIGCEQLAAFQAKTGQWVDLK